nr:heme exporter protein CcmD [Sinobacterium caligoides]
MGGHGPYVWGAYAVAAVVLISLVVQPLRVKKRFVLLQKNELRRLDRSQKSV